MSKILLVNTGPTEFERRGPYPSAGEGDPEAPLSRWALAIAKRLADYQVAAVYACPVPGAMETAEIIAGELGLTAVKMPGLGEAGLEHWKGLRPEEASAMDDCPTGAAWKLPLEDVPALQAKLAVSLGGLTAYHKKETVVVVSHRALTVVMILHLLAMPEKKYRQIAQEYGAVNLFEVRGGMPSALIINDTCHLDGLI